MTEPILTSSNRRLERLHTSALDNILRINSVSTGPSTPAILRAGGGYSSPWTRDAAINAWNGVSLIRPSLAESTLWATTEADDEGGRVVAQDNQWWDQIIWVVGAHNHWLVTGDLSFASQAYDTGSRSVRLLEHLFNPHIGLYKGGAVMQDGIAGYPAPIFDPSVASTFVLDHPRSLEIMCLSTNLIYQMAFRCLGEMAQALGKTRESQQWAVRAQELARSINSRLWLPGEDRFGYFRTDVSVDVHHETLGNALAIISEIVSDERSACVIRHQPLLEFGPPAIWPHFDRFSDRRPGRHNGIVWPMITAFWASALARQKDIDRFGTVLARFMDVVQMSDYSFWEVYDGNSGRVDGGWQNEANWASEPDQTWSASGFLRVVYDGILGLRLSPEGIRFQPLLPREITDVKLSTFTYRAVDLTLTIRGQGSEIVRILVDGQQVPPDSPVHIAASAEGAHSVDVMVQSRA